MEKRNKYVQYFGKKKDFMGNMTIQNDNNQNDKDVDDDVHNDAIQMYAS